MLLPISTDESMLDGYVKFINPNSGNEIVINLGTGEEVIDG